MFHFSPSFHQLPFFLRFKQLNKQILILTLIFLNFLLQIANIVSEETILKWFKDAHSPKGKMHFLEQMKKFVEWLQNAEEETESEEEE